MRPSSLVSAATLTAVLFAPPAIASAQLKVTVKPTVSSAEKGKVFEINVRLEASQPLDSLVIVPMASENFCMRAVPILGAPQFVANGDGSAFLGSLPASSAITVQFKVAAPTQFMGSESNCLALDSSASTRARRSPDNTRDLRTFVFDGRYRALRPDTSVHFWTESIDLKYTTSQTIFLWSGMLGVLMGYIVKSLTARRTEVNAARLVGTSRSGQLWHLLAYMFGTSVDKFLTSLVFGFGALLTDEQIKAIVEYVRSL